MPERLTADRVVDGVDGVDVVDRAAIAAATGKSRDTINHAALSDPDFPPTHARRDRLQWYRLADAQAYVDIVAARDATKKAPMPTGGDPAQLLDPTEAADEINVTTATFRHYVRLSQPFWQRRQDRDPHSGILPPPDEETPRGATLVNRRWRRDTLHTHQARRPGRGSGAGRPADTGRP